MKKIITSILIVAIIALSFSGCADRKTVNGVTYDTYGLFDSNEKENKNIQYELSIGNIVWGVILSETIIAPIYFFGFALWEPVGPKNRNPNLNGVVGGEINIPSTTNKIIYSND